MQSFTPVLLSALLVTAVSRAEPAPSKPALSRPETGQEPAATGCMQRLASIGLETHPAENGPTTSRSGHKATAQRADLQKTGTQNAACVITEPVVLTGLHLGPGEPRISFPDAPLLSCAMAEAFGVYVRDIAAPLAKGTFGKSIASIGTGPGFECRTRDHIPGARISAHAQGDAIDIASLTLSDETRIAVEAAPADERSRRLLFALRAAACGAFSTVLGPGSDRFHATHLHFDTLARGRDGKSKFCQ